MSSGITTVLIAHELLRRWESERGRSRRVSFRPVRCLLPANCFRFFIGVILINGRVHFSFPLAYSKAAPGARQNMQALVLILCNRQIHVLSSKPQM